MSSDIQAVIFDMDGVILDSESICDSAWQKAGDDFNISKTDVDTVINLCRGTSKSDSIAIIKRTLGDRFDAEGYYNKTSFYFKEIERTEGIPLMPHAKDILCYLNGTYRIALASSTHKTAVVRQLTAGGVIGFFETLTTGDMVTHSKPDPEIYQKACASIGIEPANCIAVEDSPNGILSAHRAGLKVIGVPDRTALNDEARAVCWAVLDSLNGLRDLL